MDELNSIIDTLTIKSIQNNGAAFDYQYRTISWYNVYEGKKIVLIVKWVYKRTEYYDKVKQEEKILNKLPRGVTYSKTDRISTPLPKKPEHYATLCEYHETVFTIHVSAGYSKKVALSAQGKKVILSCAFDKKTIKNAEAFCNKVVSSHSEILEPLYKDGLMRYYCLDNNGFTDYDHGYGLGSVGMKPLQNEEQRLGLILALCRYGENKGLIPDNEKLFIYKDNDNVCLRKILVGIIKPLNDW